MPQVKLTRIIVDDHVPTEVAIPTFCRAIIPMVPPHTHNNPDIIPYDETVGSSCNNTINHDVINTTIVLYVCSISGWGQSPTDDGAVVLDVVAVVIALMGTPYDP
jgi:hypothetical protein